jgi:hypothetical protein
MEECLEPIKSMFGQAYAKRGRNVLARHKTTASVAIEASVGEDELTTRDWSDL